MHTSRTKIIAYVAAIVFMLLPVVSYGSSLHVVTPLVIDVTVEARDIITKKITVTNTGDQPMTVYPTVNNISLKEGGSIEEFLTPVESDRTTSLSSWIEISRKGIDLQPGQSNTSDLTLRINPTPVPGTYHAFIGFGYGRNRDEAEAQVKAGQAPGTIVTVTIDEKKSEFLKLSKFIISRFITSSENQAAVYTFNNPGSEAVIPTGEIILYDSTGKEVGSVPVNEEGLSIPPGGEHVFSASVPADGLFGKYKAFLSVEYGNAEKATVYDTSFFYAFPLKIMLIAGACMALIVALGSWYAHRKYFDDDGDDDSDRLTFHVRQERSEAKEHDLDLKPK